jgi:hypothetical protein
MFKKEVGIYYAKLKQKIIKVKTLYNKVVYLSSARIDSFPMYSYYIELFIYFIFCGSAAQRRLWPLGSRGFVITHNDAPQSVELLLTSDQLVAETST